jgi:hypothetical protein
MTHTSSQRAVRYSARTAGSSSSLRTAATVIRWGRCAPRALSARSATLRWRPPGCPRRRSPAGTPRPFCPSAMCQAFRGSPGTGGGIGHGSGAYAATIGSWSVPVGVKAVKTRVLHGRVVERDHSMSSGARDEAVGDIIAVVETVSRVRVLATVLEISRVFRLRGRRFRARRHKRE